MPQIKKTVVNASILEAAFVLFAKQGYQATSMPEIASQAGVTAGNIYRYYKSKFELFYAVLEPWLDEQLTSLEKDIAARDGRSEKLNRVLEFMWIDLPRASNNFEINLMEALATKKPDEPYSRTLLEQSERRVCRLLEDILSGTRTAQVSADDLTHLIFMAHDGFVLNASLADETNRIREMIEGLTVLVIGSGRPADV